MSETHDSHTALSQLFVLRLSRETADAPWRATLRPAGGGQRLVFADMEQLVIFLLGTLEGSAAMHTAELPIADVDS